MWLALAIGLGVLAGHAQTAVYGLILIGAYYLWRMMSLRRSKIILSSRHLVIMSVFFALAVLIGLGLAAIQLLPAAELTRESQRAGGLESIKVLTHSYWPPRLLTLLSPDFFGNPAQNNFWGYDNYWENAAYIGVLPLLLAMWMMVKVISDWWAVIRRTNQQIITRHSSLVTRQFLCPEYTGLTHTGLRLVHADLYLLYEHVPGFDLFQGPARWLVVTVPALCVLAALGAQRWIEHGFSRRAANRLIILGLAVVVAGVAAAFVSSGRAATFGPATLRLGVLLIAAGWLFRLRIRDWRPALIVVGVVALDLITAHFALNPVLPPDIYHAPNPAAQAIKADGLAGRVFYFDADEAAMKFGKYLATDNQFTGYGPNDLAYWLNFRATLLPNAAMIDGVPSANNFDSLIIGRYQTLLDQINALPIEQALATIEPVECGVHHFTAIVRSPDRVPNARRDDLSQRSGAAAGVDRARPGR